MKKIFTISPTVAVPIFFAFLLVGLSTNWTFNLFEPQFLWKAYNYYFLSIINGSLDVPVESIGREAGYFDGKAYMYYGLLPALIRVFIYPFVDLTTTPVALFSIISFTLLGLSFLQRSINDAFYCCKQGVESYSFFLWFCLTAVSWLGSAAFVISQSGTIYHEPYAASLCLFNIYLSLLLRHGFLQDTSKIINPLGYAVLAALAVHTRMPLALAFFVTTGLIFLILSHRILVQQGKSANVLNLVMVSVRQYWLSIAIMFVGGLSILILTYVKYSNPTNFMGGNYGYYFLEGFTERRCNLMPKSEMARWLRIIPNTYIYLTGDWANHWSLSMYLKTGYGRWEAPLVPLLLLWALPFSALCTAVTILLMRIKQRQSQLLFLGLLCLSVGAVFQLTYPTITHRYIAELWPPFGVAVVWLAYAYRYNKPNTSVLILIGLLAVIGLGYQAKLTLFDKYYLDNGPIYKHHNYHYSEADHAFLSSLTPEKIKLLQEIDKQKKKAACAALAEETGMADILKSRED